MWQQNYEPIGGSLGASALVAAVPILVLFFMLSVRRQPTWVAATSALASAAVIRSSFSNRRSEDQEDNSRSLDPLISCQSFK